MNGEVRKALTIAEQVRDPELPMLTLADLGVLRGIEIDGEGTVTAILTPTYSGCPAIAEMHAEVVRRLQDAGFTRARTRAQLDPAWSSDWITPHGRRKLAEHGIAPPESDAVPVRRRPSGPVPLVLSPIRPAVPCPRCGLPKTEEISRFGATACRSLYRCLACLEPFEHVKEI